MRTYLLLAFLTVTLATHAQDGTAVGDALAGNDKLNVVAAVVAVIILGLALWMWRMDLKLGRMEKRVNK